jgi:hypothetical protein
MKPVVALKPVMVAIGRWNLRGAARQDRERIQELGKRVFFLRSAAQHQAESGVFLVAMQHD